MALSNLVMRTLERDVGQGRIRRQVSLAPYTTFKFGGPADYFFEAETADELAKAIMGARQMEIPHFLLGMGANVAIGDRGFRGLVIRNCAGGIFVQERACRITVDSGAVMYPDVIGSAIVHGLAGLEHYVGIPSTAGGALWQNLHFLAPAPARERTMFIEEVLHSADILAEDNERRTVDADYFEFGYDYSILHVRSDVVLSATFLLQRADPARMLQTARENLAWRALRHPPLSTEPSVGSIFKKIQGIGAGRLIDECGLKGATIGGITITHRHANIMTNTGEGRASDLQALIAYVYNMVLQRTGYELATEISFVGDFESPNPAAPVFLPRPRGLVTAEELARMRKSGR